jgi:branched-chain amino acid transport system substrate-binding protein
MSHRPPGRRALLAGACAAFAGARRACAQSEPAPPEPLAIGVLTDPTGIGASVSGPPLLRAVQLALADAGAMPDNRPVRLVAAEFRLKPDDAVAIARAWFDQGVAAVVDVPGSAAAAAVQGLARARGRAYLATGSVNPDLAGALCNPVSTDWATDTASIARALAGALAAMGARDWFLVVPDTLLGAALAADAARAIQQAGGRVAGRSRHAPEEADYRSLPELVAASGAQAVGLCDIGPPLADQLKALRAAPGNERKLVAFLPSIADIHAAGPEAAEGTLLAAPFHWNQNDQSRAFAQRLLADTGRMPDAAHAAAYVAVRHYLRAVAVTGTLDAAAVNKDMRERPAYFFGRSARLRLDGRLAIDLSLLRVKPAAAMQTEWDHYEAVGTIPQAAVYPALAATGCRLAF